MRVLVCGSRNWTDTRIIWNAMEVLKEIGEPIEIIHGAARGADTIAGKIATAFGFEVREFPADWEKDGRAAGPMRNKVMLGTAPDLLYAFRTYGPSRGTDHMISIAYAAGVPTRMYDINGRYRDRKKGTA